jgi:hypothetical protein
MARQSGSGLATPYRVDVLIAGSSLRHTFMPVGSGKPTSEPLTQPDDITTLNGNLFVTFQNAVGPQGTPSPSGNLDSTIIEISPTGHAVAQWDVRGHCDGLTADPAIAVPSSTTPITSIRCRTSAALTPSPSTMGRS